MIISFYFAQQIRKIKAIYHTMNMFNINVTEKCLIAECWVPSCDMDSVQVALRHGTERSGASVPSIVNRMETKQTPPTFNRTNKFTHGFQAIVDAYGVSDYQEVNPALYTLITFPFLFSVMFGDLGHGIIMALFAAWMIWAEHKLSNWRGGGEVCKLFLFQNFRANEVHTSYLNFIIIAVDLKPRFSLGGSILLGMEVFIV